MSLFPAAILAGGLGTRLHPFTEKIPKALMEINGEPFIAHQLRLLRSQGLSDVVLCAGYLGEMIHEFVGNGCQFDLRVQYSFDGPTLLGTAGALKKALPLLGCAFFVLYGDSYLLCKYQAIQDAFEGSDKIALMTVYRNEGRWDTSNVQFRNNQILKYDKCARTPAMRHIDYGLGVFSSKAFDSVVPPYDLAALYRDLLRQQNLAAFEVAQRFYEIGSFEGVAELAKYLKR